VGDRSSGRVHDARFFWGISYGDRMWFGTEIAVSKVVMEEGQEPETRGVTPDELCVPTPAALCSEKDPCLDRALALARAANRVQPLPQQARNSFRCGLARDWPGLAGLARTGPAPLDNPLLTVLQLALVRRKC
jgi:hypothetical protein